MDVTFTPNNPLYWDLPTMDDMTYLNFDYIDSFDIPPLNVPLSSLTLLPLSSNLTHMSGTTMSEQSENIHETCNVTLTQMMDKLKILVERVKTANSFGLDPDDNEQSLISEVLLWLDLTRFIDPHEIDSLYSMGDNTVRRSTLLESVKKWRQQLEDASSLLRTTLQMREALSNCERDITEQLTRMQFHPNPCEHRKTHKQEDVVGAERREAREVLMTWLMSHTRNPYPTITEKDHFVDKTGLSIKQINYWFINARRRVIPRLQEQGLLADAPNVDQEVSVMDEVNNWYKTSYPAEKA
eukprot:CFRG0717T1